MNKKIGIIGASGYTGLELVRILKDHPNVFIEIITSETHKGKKFSDLYPHLKGQADFKLESLKNLDNYDLDLVYLALPHRVSMSFVKEHGLDNFDIIDLSGDFRLDSASIYEKWYDKEHEIPELVNDAIYGLPELNKEQISKANFVANPGCYPTSSILPLAPLVKNDLIENDRIIIDAKSGVTGAGAKAKDNTHFPNVNDNFSAYGLKSHRHTPEISATLSKLTDKSIEVLFTPHLLPINRGILTVTYSKPKEIKNEEELRKIYNSFYQEHPFIRLVDSPPSILDVRGSNYCDIYVTFDERTNNYITVSVIDNLVKGAAGQAVQNMNIMYGLEQTTGLNHSPISP